MTKEEAIMSINAMDIETLIDTINDNIDCNLFPYSGIFDVNDDEGWEKVTKFCGGRRIYEATRDIPSDYEPKYFFFDEEQDHFEFFRTKEELLEFVGIDNLADNMINE